MVISFKHNDCLKFIIFYSRKSTKILKRKQKVTLTLLKKRLLLKQKTSSKKPNPINILLP